MGYIMGYIMEIIWDRLVSWVIVGFFLINREYTGWNTGWFSFYWLDTHTFIMMLEYNGNHMG